MFQKITKQVNFLNKSSHGLFHVQNVFQNNGFGFRMRAEFTHFHIHFKSTFNIATTDFAPNFLTFAPIFLSSRASVINAISISRTFFCLVQHEKKEEKSEIWLMMPSARVCYLFVKIQKRYWRGFACINIISNIIYFLKGGFLTQGFSNVLFNCQKYLYINK